MKLKTAKILLSWNAVSLLVGLFFHWLSDVPFERCVGASIYYAITIILGMCCSGFQIEEGIK